MTALNRRGLLTGAVVASGRNRTDAVRKLAA